MKKSFKITIILVVLIIIVALLFSLLLKLDDLREEKYDFTMDYLKCMKVLVESRDIKGETTIEFVKSVSLSKERLISARTNMKKWEFSNVDSIGLIVEKTLYSIDCILESQEMIIPVFTNNKPEPTELSLF